MFGGGGGRASTPVGCGGNPGFTSIHSRDNILFPTSSPGNRCFFCQINPATNRNNIWRSGAGGGATSGVNCMRRAVAGGGGGGGRGNAGNPGGCGGGGNPGSAANPTTFNCVPVTPGCTAPITVGSPGGQIVISWNPQ